MNITKINKIIMLHVNDNLNYTINIKKLAIQ